jgi:hypothetical protein
MRHLGDSSSTHAANAIPRQVPSPEGTSSNRCIPRLQGGHVVHSMVKRHVSKEKQQAHPGSI